MAIEKGKLDKLAKYLNADVKESKQSKQSRNPSMGLDSGIAKLDKARIVNIGGFAVTSAARIAGAKGISIHKIRS